MKTTAFLSRHILHFIAVASSLILFSACDMFKNGPSKDIKELQTKITFDMPSSAGRWEIFETPEYTGGVPGPTDFVTMIAEFENVSEAWKPPYAQPAGRVWVAPESPRQWLSPSFRTMFDSAVDNIIDLSNDPHCHPFNATMTKSGRVVRRFSCKRDNAVMIYLTLREPSM